MRNWEIAAAALAAQLRIAFMLWGPPGQGKSMTIRVGFSQLGYMVHVLRLTTTQPHHLGGLPVPDLPNNCYRYLPPQWVTELNKAEKGLLFFDDFSGAGPTVQISALGILDERMVGDVKLNAVVAGAANPDSLATQRFALDAAAANRMVHIKVNADPDHFRRGVMDNWSNPPVVPVVRSDWQQHREAKARMITGFVCSSEGRKLLNAMPPQINQTTVAWPSERSWTMLIDLLTACDYLTVDSVIGADIGKVRELLFKGCVGEGAHKQFLQHLRSSGLPDVQVVINQGNDYRFPAEGDNANAVLFALGQELVNASTETWGKIWKVAESAWNSNHRDRSVPLMLQLVSTSNGSSRKLPDFYRQHVQPVLELAA